MSRKSPSPAPVTDELAGFVETLDHDGLPQAVRTQMTMGLIDFFRVGAAGLGMPWVSEVRSALDRLGGAPAAAILYTDQRTDPVRAALLNGVIAGSLDWDDTHVGAMLHPGAVVWPAVLALAETTGASGAAMLTAAAAGYEAMIRIGLGVQPAHFRRGFQATATCGVFGAAAAAARLLGLDRDGTRDAMGLAASYAGGITQFFLSGSEVKRLHAGKAAAAGVEAALLAQSGLTGPHDALEGVQGLGRAMADGIDAGTALAGLGSEYRLLGLQFKPHAVSARVLAAVECAERLVAQGIRENQIETVEIGVPSVVMGRLTVTKVRTLQQAQMSAPFAVALALALAPETEGPLVLGISEIEAGLGTPRIDALLAKTTCTIDAKMEAGLTAQYCPARVTLALSDGRSVEETVMCPMGSVERPMSLDEISARFAAVAGPVVGRGAAQLWLEKARNAGALPDAGALLDLRARS